MSSKDVIIYGAGRYGRAAYAYYSGLYNVICFIDSDISKCGTEINGIKVLGIQTLREYNCDLVIAVKKDKDRIARALKFYKGRIYLFDIVETNYIETKQERLFEKYISIYFSGGLGNQMFQYALYIVLKLQDKNVKANISYCDRPGKDDFRLSKVFPRINFQYSTLENEKDMFVEIGNELSVINGYLIYDERMNKGMTKEASKYLLGFDCGIIKGLHQTAFFASLVRDELLNEFSFMEKKEKKLLDIIKTIGNQSVSIHIRRGDYIKEDNIVHYGNICTFEYYKNAINYIEEKIDNPQYYVFSDDIKYVQENFIIEGAIYVTPDMFDFYEDWYDMCLMSKCKHNIIANSTFSWWGAWLNQNPSKIVIAPKKWINTYEYIDIYPKEWITI